MTIMHEKEAITATQVFHDTEGQTVFVTPHRDEGYSFRVAATCWRTPKPSFEHHMNGDIVTFPPPRLTEGDIRRIADFAGVNTDSLVHYPGGIKNFTEQIVRVRKVLGPIIES